MRVMRVKETDHNDILKSGGNFIVDFVAELVVNFMLGMATS